MIKAVAYCRYSSDRQREESIEAQLRAINEYAKSNNISIVKEYIDRALSGTFDERQAFKAMIRDSEKDLFELVLTHKVDRFARNRYDSAIYKRKLRENNVKVIYVAQPISDGPEGAMMEAMLEGMAEYYSRNLAQETMKGLKENAYDCRHCGGKPPLGYDVDPVTKKYIINKHEAYIIQYIFELYQQGIGYIKLINALNKKGYRTKYGNVFGKNSIYEILRNEKYTGTYVFNRAAKKVKGKFNKRSLKTTDEIIKVPEGMPQIISYEVWKEIQDKMDSHKHNGRRSKETYLLSGLLICGICGSAMTTDTRYMKDRDKVYCYYRCFKNNGKNECSMQAWSRDDLEEMVILKLKEEMFSGENLQKMVQKIFSYYNEYASTMNEDIVQLKHELSGIKKRIGNLITAISEGDELKTLKEALKNFEQQKDVYENKITELEISKKTMIPSEKMIRDYLKKRSSLFDLGREDLKDLVNENIKSIHVYTDRIDVNAFVNIVGCGRPYTIIFTIAV
jgi:site-specific DNA recombinase